LAGGTDLVGMAGTEPVGCMGMAGTEPVGCMVMAGPEELVGSGSMGMGGPEDKFTGTEGEDMEDLSIINFMDTGIFFHLAQ
jgi:hypothetical protein